MCRKDTALKSVIWLPEPRLSRDQAKELLLQSADINDPQVRCMLREIERTSEEARLIELLAAKGCTGVVKERKPEIVNRSIILNPFLLQDTHQRPIDLGISSSYLRDELERSSRSMLPDKQPSPYRVFQERLRVPSSGLRKASATTS
jgi:hypothetical protein